MSEIITRSLNDNLIALYNSVLEKGSEVAQILIDQNLSISIIDSCTEGLLSNVFMSLLTNSSLFKGALVIPQNSEVILYNNHDCQGCNKELTNALQYAVDNFHSDIVIALLAMDDQEFTAFYRVEPHMLHCFKGSLYYTNSIEENLGEIWEDLDIFLDFLSEATGGSSLDSFLTLLSDATLSWREKYHLSLWRHRSRPTITFSH